MVVVLRFVSVMGMLFTIVPAVVPMLVAIIPMGLQRNAAFGDHLYLLRRIAEQFDGFSEKGLYLVSAINIRCVDARYAKINQRAKEPAQFVR